MKTTNNQISKEAINLLKTLKGKVLNSITHEPFTPATFSYGLVYMTIDGVVYALTDYQVPVDYFGGIEDLSLIKFELHNGPKKSNLKGVKFVTDKIGRKISGITLVNSEQIIKDKETGDEHTFLDTQCIIFTFDGKDQMSFAKDDFCEMISVYRGNDAKKDIEDFLNDYLNGFTPDVEGKSRIVYIDL